MLLVAIAVVAAAAAAIGGVVSAVVAGNVATRPLCTFACKGSSYKFAAALCLLLVCGCFFAHSALPLPNLIGSSTKFDPVSDVMTVLFLFLR